MRFQHDAAHAHRLSLGEPEKLRLALTLLRGKFEVDMAVNVDHACHHVIVKRHLVIPEKNLKRKKFTAKNAEGANLIHVGVIVIRVYSITSTSDEHDFP